MAETLCTCILLSTKKSEKAEKDEDCQLLRVLQGYTMQWTLRQPLHSSFVSWQAFPAAKGSGWISSGSSFQFYLPFSGASLTKKSLPIKSLSVEILDITSWEPP